MADKIDREQTPTDDGTLADKDTREEVLKEFDEYMNKTFFNELDLDINKDEYWLAKSFGSYIHRKVRAAVLALLDAKIAYSKDAMETFKHDHKMFAFYDGARSCAETLRTEIEKVGK